ncbi:MAG: hypothetical protein MK078_11105 [Crocinitomicaceae bacterium]|nr:hypothetical protein [Crocinitomicaceae bacterium]
MDKHLHIISFDVPLPANYGGIIDVFYKLKALHELGVKVHLHAFYYEGKNQPTKELENYCDEVSYYKRSTGFLKFLTRKDPYIVSSRADKELLKNLKKDDYPILFEGLHTTAFLNNPELKQRTTLVRAHNIEHEYYAELGRNASGLKERYYKTETSRLQKYEAVLKNADVILSISKAEVEHFQNHTKTIFIPAFYNDEKRGEVAETGNYVLFHGNLGVEENENAVRVILGELGNKLKSKLIVAGANPSQKLRGFITSFSNTELKENPDEIMMKELIQTAKVNVLYAEKSAGVKLKLIHALNLGGHAVINDALNDQGMFSEVCKVTEKQELLQEVQELLTRDYSDNEIEFRDAFMRKNFNNLANASKILELI